METSNVMAPPARHRPERAENRRGTRPFHVGGYGRAIYGEVQVRKLANFALDPFVYGPRAWGSQ